MFGNKRLLKQIENQKKELLLIKEQLEKDKQELLFIKESLDSTYPKIDVSNIYVWEDGGIYNIVKLDTKKVLGRNFLGNATNGYHSTLIDIFSNTIVYEQDSTELPKGDVWISGQGYYDGHYAQLLTLFEVDNNLLAYVDKKIPFYVLQQLFYKLNDVNVNARVLKKEK